MSTTDTALQSARTSAMRGPAAEAMLQARALPEWSELVRLLPVTRRQVTQDQPLFAAGQPFRSLFLVHSGFYKVTVASADGRERVTAFPMRGDLLGIESIGSDVHTSSAVALDSGEAWELPYPAMLTAARQVPSLQDCLTTALAATVRTERSWAMALGTLGATARVALLLLELARRQQSMGFSGRHLTLRMTRAEIGSFLGLQLETVARSFSQLAAQGAIDVKRRQIELRDTELLFVIAGASPLEH